MSLTLSPALCAMLLKPHDPQHRDAWWEKPIHGFFRLFNRGFDGVRAGDEAHTQFPVEVEELSACAAHGPEHSG